MWVLRFEWFSLWFRVYGLLNLLFWFVLIGLGFGFWVLGLCGGCVVCGLTGNGLLGLGEMVSLGLFILGFPCFG